MGAERRNGQSWHCLIGATFVFIRYFQLAQRKEVNEVMLLRRVHSKRKKSCLKFVGELNQNNTIIIGHFNCEHVSSAPNLSGHICILNFHNHKDNLLRWAEWLSRVLGCFFFLVIEYLLCRRKMKSFIDCVDSENAIQEGIHCRRL